MFRRRSRPFAVAVALVAALAVALPAAANTQKLHGRFTWMHEDANGILQIFTARADLTHARQVTHGDSNSGWPVWSPDSRHIAFDGDAADPDRSDDIAINDVFTMRDDGTRIQNLTGGVGFAGDAAYSLDGRTIAFETDRGDYPALQGIYLMDARDGGHKRRVTTIPGDGWFDGSARFSPDGRWVVFTRFFTPPGGAEVSDLYVVRLDGSGMHRITPHGMHPGDAAWSPDGNLIVFEADLINGRGDAWLVRPDGTGFRNLTFRPPEPGHWDGFSDPVFSPDGKLVLLVHGLHDDDGSGTGGLATIRVDGSDLRYVGDGRGEEHQADWGPTWRR